MREFESGACRDSDDGKLDFDGFVSLEALVAFAKYMDRHRAMRDGSTRSSSNWKKGMPESEVLKSLWRHFIDVAQHVHAGPPADSVDYTDALCAMLFNVQILLHQDQGGRDR
jgi:hypothetical protein